MNSSAAAAYASASDRRTVVYERGQRVAQRSEQERVGFERVERFGQGRRVPRDASFVAGSVREVGGIDVDRRRRDEFAVDAVEPGRDQGTEGDVGIRRRVRRLELQVRARCLVAPERRRDAHRCLSVVRSPTHERRAPVLWQQAGVGVERRGRQRQQAGRVGQDPGEELLGERRQPVPAGRIVEQVALVLPRAEVHVGTVAGLIGPGLRRERGDQAAPRGNAANRLADQHLCVCCGERRPWQHGQLVLPVAELGVVLVERDLLGVEGVDDRIDHLGTGRHPDGREAQAGVDGHRSFAVEVGQRELVLDGAAQLDPVLGETGGHAGQEAAGHAGYGVPSRLM